MLALSWQDYGAGRCETTQKQFGETPPHGWSYDTQAALSGSLTYSAGPISLDLCKSLCLTDLKPFGCSYVSWGHGDTPSDGFCYAAVSCASPTYHSNYHSYVFAAPPPPPPPPRPPPPQPPHQDKIEHFVVLYMENRPFDHIFGCMLDNEGLMPGADGVKDGQRILIDPDDPSKGSVNISCGTAQMVCPGYASYSLFAPKFKPDAKNVGTYPYDPQSSAYDYARGAKGESIEMFSGEQLPVKRAVAQHFGVFNHLYTAVPSASYPNHQFTQSATSCGVMDNVVDWAQCGGNQTRFPQRTIYDALAANGNSFAMYYNDTPA